MSVIYKGAGIATSHEWTYTQDQGLIYSQRERGVPSAIYARARAWRNQGYDVTTRADGPYVDLLATRNRLYQLYPFIERWTVTTETLEKSLYSLPKVMAEMESGLFGIKGMAGYVKSIEDKVKEQDPTYGLAPVADDVVKEMKRGVESFETEYTVISRTLTFDFQHPPSEYESNLQMKLDPIKYIYTAAQIGIPPEVKFVLPTDGPTGIKNTMWGYRIREQTAEMTNSTTGMHRTTWVYAMWSTFLYTPKT